jgi:hypothetical protein
MLFLERAFEKSPSGGMHVRLMKHVPSNSPLEGPGGVFDDND